MFSRTSVTFAMTLLLVVAHLHCLCHEEVQPLGNSTVFAGQPLRNAPVPERHCDNEYGCICKGATIASPVVCDEPLANVNAALPMFDPTFERSQANDVARSSAEFLSTPPLSGRMLRAHLASLVI